MIRLVSAEKGIELVAIDITALDGKLPWEQEYLRRGYLAYRFLKGRDDKDEERFDIIHFPECNGFGYYSALAKSTLCIGTHGSTRWAIASNHRNGSSPPAWSPAITLAPFSP